MKTLIDIECFPNFFMLGVWDYNTKEKKYWEISEHRDDRASLFKFLNDYKGYWISFNGKHYDDVVLTWFVKQYYEDLHELPVWQLTSKLKEFSDKVINSEQFYEELKTYKYGWSKKVTQVDLFLFWSKGLRLSKKISLKSLAIQLNWNHIQELPYPHNQTLSFEEIEEVKKYNLNNDLGILDRLIDRMAGDIQLREWVKSNLGIECWTYDAPKIASEALLLDYCTKTGKDLKEVRALRNPTKTFKYGDKLPHINFKTVFFKNLYEEIKNSYGGFSKTFVYNTGEHNIKLSLMKGGLHSVNDNEVYRTSKTHRIITSDAGAMYPTIFCNLKLLPKEILDKAISIKQERFEAKKQGLKLKDTFLKLCNNSVSGLLDNEYSWLYDNEAASVMRMYGQLVLLRVIEENTLMGNRIISANTDKCSVG